MVDRVRSSAAGFFLVGLLCRLVVFTGAHVEGDENIYRALVGQLEAGRGFNLLGTPLLERLSPELYGHPLFFHPPGGIVLFLLFHRIAGELAYPLVQVLSYVLFFWSMLALARAALGPLGGVRLHVVCALAAFSPIMTHVATHYWLDGPLLAFATLGSALFVSGVQRGTTRRVVLAAAAIGYASWIKIAALAVVPGLLLLGLALAEPERRTSTLRLGLIFTGLVATIQLPWELWQWRVVGSPFPTWAGRPPADLIARNKFVYSITVTRPAWMYLTLMPRVLWTCIPSLACLFLLRLEPRVRRIALALVIWIAVVLAAMMTLGTTGSSKLLRYAITVTPATILLFLLLAGEVWRARADVASGGRASGNRAVLVRPLLVLAAAGLVLEVFQGLYMPLAFRDAALIMPILGQKHWLF